MREAGADFAVLQRYVGHSPNSILAAHYDFMGMDRLRAIALLAEATYSHNPDSDGLQQLVPIERGLDGKKIDCPDQIEAKPEVAGT